METGLRPYDTFTVQEIMTIGMVDKPLATLLQRQFLGKGYNYADAVEGRKQVHARIQELGEQASDIAWKEAYVREHIRERMEVCKRRIKRWRRLERHMRGKQN